MLIKQKVKLYEEKNVSKLKASAMGPKNEKAPAIKSDESSQKNTDKSRSNKPPKQNSTFNDIL